MEKQSTLKICLEKSMNEMILRIFSWDHEVSMKLDYINISILKSTDKKLERNFIE